MLSMCVDVADPDDEMKYEPEGVEKVVAMAVAMPLRTT